MTSSVQEVVSDAKKLAHRLKKHDGAADQLLAKAHSLEKTIESMKEVSVPLSLSVSVCACADAFIFSPRLRPSSAVTHSITMT